MVVVGAVMHSRPSKYVVYTQTIRTKKNTYAENLRKSSKKTHTHTYIYTYARHHTPAGLFLPMGRKISSRYV